MARVPLASWNGKIMPLDRVKVSVLDRGFLFGDAVYEGIRIYDGQIWLLKEHLDRLHFNLAQLQFANLKPQILERIESLLTRSAVENGFIYLQITRGEGWRAHVPHKTCQPNELIYIMDIADDYRKRQQSQGISVSLHPDLRWRRADIKTTNLLGNCLAAMAASDKGSGEALLFNDEGYITEGSHTNFFAVKEAKIYTTPAGTHILPGITKDVVISLAKGAGIGLEERLVHKAELETMEEVFLSGTTTEIMPVTKVDDQVIGDGLPGEITKRIAESYGRAVSDGIGER